MLANRSIPNGTVIPVLAYPDVGEAIDWLCDTFGFTLRLRIGNHRAQLNVGDGAVVVAEGSSSPGRVMVRVENVNDHHTQVLQRRARVLDPPVDFPYGERQYTVEDLAGYRWTFSQSIADIDPKDWGGVLVDH